MNQRGETPDELFESWRRSLEDDLRRNLAVSLDRTDVSWADGTGGQLDEIDRIINRGHDLLSELNSSRRTPS